MVFITMLFLFVIVVGCTQTTQSSGTSEGKVSSSDLSSDDVYIINISWQLVRPSRDIDNPKNDLYAAYATITFYSKKDNLEIVFVNVNDVWVGNYLKQYVNTDEISKTLMKGGNNIKIHFMGYDEPDNFKEIKYCFRKYTPNGGVIQKGKEGVICKTERLLSEPSQELISSSKSPPW